MLRSPESSIRLLDPVTDIDLFREAYKWRSERKKHVQPDRMSFETFASQDPNQIVLGGFNEQLEAVYVLTEYAPKRFEVHFTSSRNGTRETYLEWAKEIRDAFLANGAEELTAWILPRNRALRSFVEALDFKHVETVAFCSCGDLECESKLPTEQRLYAKYAVFKEPS